MKLPLTFAGSQLVDGDGNHIDQRTIIQLLSLHHDLVRGLDSMLRYAQRPAIPVLVWQDAEQTVKVAKALAR